MEKRAGRYRFQLMVSATTRRALHNLLTPWIESVENSKKTAKVRWSIDIDPVDLY
jgi:primosomal protein N' (replication factor Y)